MTALLVAASLLAAVPGGTPPAPRAGQAVALVGITGLPADSLDRGTFLEAFEATFADAALPAQVPAADGDGWQSSGAFDNRFRLLAGDEAPGAAGAWQLAIELGVPPVVKLPAHATHAPSRPRRATRGLAAVITVRTPAAVAKDEAGAVVQLALAFPDPAAYASTSLPPSRLGYDYPWARAGRSLALAALEQLHLASGDLLPPERFDLAPALRASPRSTP